MCVFEMHLTVISAHSIVVTGTLLPFHCVADFGVYDRPSAVTFGLVVATPLLRVEQRMRPDQTRPPLSVVAAPPLLRPSLAQRIDGRQKVTTQSRQRETHLRPFIGRGEHLKQLLKHVLRKKEETSDCLLHQTTPLLISSLLLGNDFPSI